MVYGEGDIADRFIDYSLQDKYLIFAGNIHDSMISDPAKIEHEESAVKLALNNCSDRVFIYLSTCSILASDYENSLYVKHKLKMEDLISKSGRKFHIFRLPSLVGVCNIKSNLTNFLVSSISRRETIDIWKHAQKNIIDIDDVHLIIGEILSRGICRNKIINIANPNNISLLAMLHKVENFLDLKANVNACDMGGTYEIKVDEIKPILDDLALKFDEKYFDKLLKKYYGSLVKEKRLLSIVVPTYNEEHGIEEFYRRTSNVLNTLSLRFDYELIFINDASSDRTLSKLNDLATKDTKVRIINFSRNFGNQAAITAGIDYAKGDAVVIIDDDLQDPPEIILNLIRKWEDGYKVVYGIRPKRAGVNIVFRFLAKIYYRILRNLSDTNIPNDTGDFRLVDRIVVNILKDMKEESRYYRGLVSWVGFSQIGVKYNRDKRFAGNSTFSLKKYINFAITGVASFTDKPLYFSSIAGIIITTLSFICALIIVIEKILDPSISIRGWTSLVVIFIFFGGIQLLSIGVLGLYLSKIFREVKRRPIYVVDDSVVKS